MTKKKYRNMVTAMVIKILANDDKTIDGKTLAWYRDKDLTTIKANSYAEAWNMLKPARDLVGM